MIETYRNTAKYIRKLAGDKLDFPNLFSVLKDLYSLSKKVFGGVIGRFPSTEYYLYALFIQGSSLYPCQYLYLKVYYKFNSEGKKF